MLKHRKPIKKLAFALSLAALLVWCAFGTGTSLAWFQDESNVVKNVINMAEFDLELSYKVGDTYTSVEGASTIFDPNALYEPGYTQVVYLRVDNAGGVDFTKPVLLGYTGISDALLLKYIEDSRHIWEEGLDEVRYTTIGSVIGTHAGPGAVAVAFFKM